MNLNQCLQFASVQFSMGSIQAVNGSMVGPAMLTTNHPYRDPDIKRWAQNDFHILSRIPFEKLRTSKRFRPGTQLNLSYQITEVNIDSLVKQINVSDESQGQMKKQSPGHNLFFFLQKNENFTDIDDYLNTIESDMSQPDIAGVKSLSQEFRQKESVQYINGSGSQRSLSQQSQLKEPTRPLKPKQKEPSSPALQTSTSRTLKAANPPKKGPTHNVKLYASIKSQVPKEQMKLSDYYKSSNSKKPVQSANQKTGQHQQQQPPQTQPAHQAVLQTKFLEEEILNKKQMATQRANHSPMPMSHQPISKLHQQATMTQNEASEELLARQQIEAKLQPTQANQVDYLDGRSFQTYNNHPQRRKHKEPSIDMEPSTRKGIVKETRNNHLEPPKVDLNSSFQSNRNEVVYDFSLKRPEVQQPIKGLKGTSKVNGKDQRVSQPDHEVRKVIQEVKQDVDRLKNNINLNISPSFNSQRPSAMSQYKPKEPLKPQYTFAYDDLEDYEDPAIIEFSWDKIQQLQKK